MAISASTARNCLKAKAQIEENEALTSRSWRAVEDSRRLLDAVAAATAIDIVFASKASA